MKPVKVFLYGQRLRDIYPHATKWQVFKYRVGQFTRKVVILSFASLILFTTFKVGSYSGATTVYAVPENSLQNKVEELKSELLDTIESCESASKHEDDGIIVFDSNNKASIGTFQFQKATVIHYYKTLFNKDITGKEAVLIALDSSKARELAKEIVFNSPKGLSNWYNCTQKYGLETQLSIINKLEK